MDTDGHRFVIRHYLLKPRPLAVVSISNDEAGEKYTVAVASAVLDIDPQAKIKIVLLPGLRAGGDIADLVEDLDSKGDKDIRTYVEAICDGTADFKLPRAREAVLVNAADIVTREVQWSWQDKIAMGRCTIIAGVGGIGKSFFTTYLTSRITSGGAMPDGCVITPGRVIFISGEDDPADVTVPRLRAHKADCSKIDFIRAVKQLDPETKKESKVCFALEDVDVLKEVVEHIEQTHDAISAVIVDPIGSFIGSRTDSNTDNAVRAVLGPVAMLAEKYGFAVVLVAHHRKTIGGTADDLILGSRAFSAFARSSSHVFQDPADEDRRVLLAGKNNLAKRSRGLAFSIGGDPASLQWYPSEIMQTADQWVAEMGKNNDPAAQRESAVFLKTELVDGAVFTTEMKKRAKDAGIAWRTIERAKPLVKVIVEKEELTKKWQMRLPKPGKGNLADVA